MEPAARLLEHRNTLEEKKVTEATGTSVQGGSEANSAAGLGRAMSHQSRASLAKISCLIYNEFIWSNGTSPRNGGQVDHTCACLYLWPDTWQDKLHYVFGYA